MDVLNIAMLFTDCMIGYVTPIGRYDHDHLSLDSYSFIYYNFVHGLNEFYFLIKKNQPIIIAIFLWLL